MLKYFWNAVAGFSGLIWLSLMVWVCWRLLS